MSDLESDYQREADETEARQWGIHHLKSHPRMFNATREGTKTFEVRLDDRHFRVGDHVVLHEWDPVPGAARIADGYTGCTVTGTITYVLRAEEVIVRDVLREGHVVLGIKWDHLR